MGSSAAAAAAAAAADSAQWLSVKEETIFLHDGLIRVTDLAELPSEILGAPEAADTDLEVSEAVAVRDPALPTPARECGSASSPRPGPASPWRPQVRVGAGPAGGGRALQPPRRLWPRARLLAGDSSAVSF